MLLTVGDREILITMPSFCWKNLKVWGSQANFQQLHDGFDLQDRPFCQCVIVVLISYDL
jgi:hypothetical protein